jgi:hypothetical protein
MLCPWVREGRRGRNEERGLPGRAIRYLGNGMPERSSNGLHFYRTVIDRRRRLLIVTRSETQTKRNRKAPVKFVKRIRFLIRSLIVKFPLLFVFCQLILGRKVLPFAVFLDIEQWLFISAFQIMRSWIMRSCREIGVASRIFRASE